MAVECKPACAPNVAQDIPGVELPCGNGVCPPDPGSEIVTEDTTSIDLEGNGSIATPLTATLILDPAVDNTAEITANGLYVPPGGGGLTEVTTTNSDDVAFSGNGTVGTPLSASVIIDPAPGNALSSSPAGLLVNPGATITTTDGDTVNLSGDGSGGTPLTAEVILDPDGSNILSASAAGLLATAPATDVEISDTATINLGGNGSVATPLNAAVIISPTGGNQLTADAGGLYVPGGSGISDVTTTDSTTIDFSGDGTPGTPLTASAKISATGGNVLTSDGTGLYVPTPAGGLSAVDTTDTATVSFTGDGTGGTPLEADVNLSATAGNQVTAAGDGLNVSPLVSVITDATTNRNLTAVDGHARYIRMTNAAAKTVTVQTNAVAAIPVGTVIAFVNAGLGDLTVTPSGGVTINKPMTQTFALIQYATATLTKVGTDEWDLAGGMEAI